MEIGFLHPSFIFLRKLLHILGVSCFHLFSVVLPVFDLGVLVLLPSHSDFSNRIFNISGTKELEFTNIKL